MRYMQTKKHINWPAWSISSTHVNPIIIFTSYNTRDIRNSNCKFWGWNTHICARPQNVLPSLNPLVASRPRDSVNHSLLTIIVISIRVPWSNYLKHRLVYIFIQTSYRLCKYTYEFMHTHIHSRYSLLCLRHVLRVTH